MEQTFEVRDMRNGKWFWSNEQMLKAKIPHTVKLTYFALCLFANKGGECHPGMRRIAEITGISRSSVIRAIESLRKTRVISVEKGVGRDNPNEYTLLKINGIKVTLLEKVSQDTRKRCHLAQIKGVTRETKQYQYNKTKNNRGFETLRNKIQELCLRKTI